MQIPDCGRRGFVDRGDRNYPDHGHCREKHIRGADMEDVGRSGSGYGYGSGSGYGSGYGSGSGYGDGSDSGYGYG